MQRRFTTFCDTVTGEYLIAISSISESVSRIPSYPNARRLSRSFIGFLKVDTVDRLTDSFDIVVLM